MTTYTIATRNNKNILQVSDGFRRGWTYFYNDADLAWLEAGGKPKRNPEGFLVMPFGHQICPGLYSTAEKLGVNPNDKPGATPAKLTDSEPLKDRMQRLFGDLPRPSVKPKVDTATPTPVEPIEETTTTMSILLKKVADLEVEKVNLALEVNQERKRADYEAGRRELSMTTQRNLDADNLKLIKQRDYAQERFEQAIEKSATRVANLELTPGSNLNVEVKLGHASVTMAMYPGVINTRTQRYSLRIHGKEAGTKNRFFGVIDGKEVRIAVSRAPAGYLFAHTFYPLVRTTKSS